jgi:adenylosuccinate synthase
MAAKIQIVVGGAYGSEAKGAVAGYLATGEELMLAIRVAGPNAGHSVVHPTTGKKYALRQVPVAAVTNPTALLGIAAGSEIDPYVLHEEVSWLENDGIDVRRRLVIDPAATWLTPAHVEREQASTLTSRIGSTSKGIGQARAERAMRTAQTVGQNRQSFDHFGVIQDVALSAGGMLNIDGTVQIEGTQGYGLGLHTGNYPQVTSSDCTALDFLAMARINPWTVPADRLEIWVVFRPYPIRVAGNSGPLRGETSWDELGLPPEYTTVTKKLRRVGLWDGELAAAAIDANGGTNADLQLALTMADQIDPALAGATDLNQVMESKQLRSFLDQFEQDCGRLPAMITTSDRTHVRL